MASKIVERGIASDDLKTYYPRGEGCDFDDGWFYEIYEDGNERFFKIDEDSGGTVSMTIASFDTTEEAEAFGKAQEMENADGCIDFGYNLKLAAIKNKKEYRKLVKHVSDFLERV